MQWLKSFGYYQENGWYGGIGAFSGMLFETSFYCYMGTQISKTDDYLCAVIYDTKWNEYDLVSQRAIMMLLRESQVSKEMDIGFIGPLSLVTLINFLKSMYSYFTVLSEMM
ncbi:Odorant receptor 22c [Pseudolycoriella hygida]|uniref:Odorant receptor 22c n=1 Tax=Pseudolycoriella hygida TaxID=35572 RepID=A0A9Q0S7F7_9DIPT|nr:Odorant receptor 22c [Pseudolycoriella hygida]